MSFSIERFTDMLNVSFEPLKITYQELDYNGNIPVFFVRWNKLEELEDKWLKLVESIAFDFQSQLTDEFQIWNIYLFFVCSEKIGDTLSYNSLKLKIENDTFSSRKIMVEEQDENKIIDEHIINRNIHFSEEKISSQVGKFEANPILWSILEDKVLKKQKLTTEAGSSFEKLVMELKKLTHEI